MIYDYHVVLGAIGALLGIIAYALYFRSIFRGVTKPHLFTWVIYFLTDIIVFAAQVAKDAGPGAWVTFTGVIGTFCVSLLALWYGEKRIKAFDWVSFILALGAIVPWVLTGDPLFSVIIAAGINFLAIAPTFRKAYEKPHEESISIWLVDSIRFSFAIAALTTLSLTTALFPAALVTGNIFLIAMIWIRRWQLRVDID